MVDVETVPSSISVRLLELAKVVTALPNCLPLGGLRWRPIALPSRTAISARADQSPPTPRLSRDHFHCVSLSDSDDRHSAIHSLSSVLSRLGPHPSPVETGPSGGRPGPPLGGTGSSVSGTSIPSTRSLRSGSAYGLDWIAAAVRPERSAGAWRRSSLRTRRVGVRRPVSASGLHRASEREP